MRFVLILILSLSLGLSGCSGSSRSHYSDKVTPLAEIPNLELVLDRFADFIVIVLTFDPEQLEGCVIAAPSLSASFNGVPIDFLARGSSMRSDDNDSWAGCDEPYFLTKMPVQPPGRFTVADESLTITGEVGDALAPREMTLVPEGPGTFAPGQMVTVRWTPAGDLAAAPPIVNLSTSQSFIAEPPAAVDGNLITFTLPAQALGEVTLSISFHRESVLVPCTGARCRMELRGVESRRSISIR